ncbi:hypothetical protein AZI86_18210 [Bdellovibrio bacteriovorus]|uniref:Cell wall surface anchor family protein n=1 Tax=Bdellovibrio bacteriovorus TaxID=959 RepID=A0A150WF89_BDEBC|nr:hypothetical protein AZI86_18210 [Bdellovibrio bacteriovorus]
MAFVLSGTFLLSSPSWAAPTSLTYQGRIIASDGIPLEYPSVSFEFRIMNPSGSCVIYREQKNGVDMTHSKGVFDTPIGSGTKLFPSNSTFTLPDSFDNSVVHQCEGGATYSPIANDGRLLRVQFHDGRGWKSISPDNIIRSVPYSSYASKAASADTIGNKSVADLVLKSSIPTCASGEVLTSSSSGILSCVADASSGTGGSVTNIATGTGLTGGPITTTGTISIANGGVGTTQLADGSVTAAKLETVSGLSAGSYGGATAIPSVTVDAKGRVTAISTNSITGLLPAASGVNGKFLKSDGSSWTGQNILFSDIKNSAGASAFNVSSCDANQTVAWSSLTDSFTCQNIGSLDASVITAGTLDAARLPSSVTDGLWSSASGSIYRSTGKVGIGVTSPTSKLEVSSGPNGFNPVFKITGSGAYTASYTNSKISATETTNSTTNASKIGLDIQSTGTWTGSNATNTALNVNATGGTTNYAAIFSGGNVGIGTMSPGALLEVNGKAKALEICLGADCRTNWPATGTGTVTNIATGTGLTGGPITSSGTISIASSGVGTTEIADGAVTSAKLETVSGLSAGSYGSATAVPSITVDAKGRITAVSTNSITGLLPAASGANGKFLKSDGSSWTGQNILFSDINGSLNASTITAGTLDAARLPSSITDGAWSAASGNVYRNTGKIGIGTSTPQASLDVVGGIKIGDDSDSCPGTSNAKVGTMRFNGGNLQICGSSAWTNVASGGSGSHIESGTIDINASADFTVTYSKPFSTTPVLVFGAVSQSGYAESFGSTMGAACTPSTTGFCARMVQFNGGYSRGKLHWVAMDPGVISGIGGSSSPTGGSGSGTVTDIATGTGLTGGPITGSGTISIANGGVNTTQIADGAVTQAKLETVSGLTAGSYGSASAIPSVTVDAKGRVTAISTSSITGLPAASSANGKFLKSDGSIWAGQNILFSDIKNSVGGSAFNVASCAANQTVAWSSLTDSFTCQNIGSLNASAITAGTIDVARLPSSVTDSLWSSASGNAYRTSGNVGIGTNSPASKLQVDGGIQIGNDTGSCPGTSNIKVGTLRYVSGSSIELCTGSGWTTIGAATSTVVSGTYTGNGNASQSINLGFRPKAVIVKNINGTYDGQTIMIDGIPDNAKHLRSYISNGNIGDEFHVNITATGFDAEGNGNDSVFNTNGSTYYYVAIGQGGSSSWVETGSNVVKTSGNVGIGTTSPSSPLTVNGTIESKSGGIKFPDGSTQTTAATGISIPARAYVAFHWTGSAVVIDSSVNVSSVVRDGTGLYTITFSTPMPNTNYSMLASLSGDADVYIQSSSHAGPPSNKTTTTCQIGVGITGVGMYDPTGFLGLTFIGP